MRLITVLCLFIFIGPAFAGIILSPGLDGQTHFKSKAKDDDGHHYLDAGFMHGLGGDIEVTLGPYFSLNAHGNFISGRGEVQYDFEGTTADDLPADIVSINIFVGPRLRWLNFGSIKSFIGWGYATSNIELTYDENEYLDQNLTDADFKDHESSSTKGVFYEAGFEVGFSKNSGFRALGRVVKYESGEFKTLAEEKIQATVYQIGLHYMHYVDLSVFWK